MKVRGNWVSETASNRAGVEQRRLEPRSCPRTRCSSCVHRPPLGLTVAWELAPLLEAKVGPCSLLPHSNLISESGCLSNNLCQEGTQRAALLNLPLEMCPREGARWTESGGKGTEGRSQQGIFLAFHCRKSKCRRQRQIHSPDTAPLLAALDVLLGWFPSLEEGRRRECLCWGLLAGQMFWGR